MARATRTFLGLSLALVASAAWAVAGDEPKEPPKIRSVVPASAFRGQTVDVAIEGTALYPADEVSSTRPEIGIVVQTSSTPFKLMLRLTIPDTAAAGSVPITVKTKIGTIKTEKLQVKLRTPVVNRVRPDLVRRGAEYDLVVEGLRLAITGAETKATVDPPMTAKRTKSADASLTIHLTVPPDTPPGPKTLTLETADGKATVAFSVALSPPSVTGVMPASVARGTKVEMTIKGKALAAAAPVVLAAPDPAFLISPRGDPTADSLPLSVTVTKEAAAGARLLIVRTPDGVVAVTVTVTVPHPVLSAVSPNGAARGTTTALSLAGSDLGSAPALRIVPADPSITIEPAQAQTPAKATVAPDAMIGPRTLLAETPDGIAAATFTVSSRVPAITGIAPGDVVPGTTTDLAIEGKNLEGARWSIVPADPSLVLTPGETPERLKIEVKADARPGPRSLYLRTPEGGAIGTLVVRGSAPGAPAIASAQPLRITRGAATELVLAGINLKPRGDKPPDVVALADDGSAVPVTVVSSGGTELHLKLSAPAKTPLGPVTIAVSTPEGATAVCVHVAPAPPIVKSVTPARFWRPYDGGITLQGSGLVAPDGTKPTVVLARPDGSGAIPVQLTQAAPDAVVVKAVVPSDTPPGPYVLTVTTPEGAAGVPIPLESLPPEVDTIVPALVGVPTTLDTTVEGRFLTQPGGKPPEVTVTRIGSATSVKAQVLEARADTLKIRLITPPGTAPGPHVLLVKTVDGTAAALFVVTDAPPPRIDSIDNAAGIRLGTIRTAIHGAGLLGATDVLVSGKGVAASVLPGGTDKDLLVQFAVAADAEPGVRTITVVGPGGAATNDKVTLTVK